MSLVAIANECFDASDPGGVKISLAFQVAVRLGPDGHAKAKASIPASSSSILTGFPKHYRKWEYSNLIRNK